MNKQSLRYESTKWMLWCSRCNVNVRQKKNQINGGTQRNHDNTKQCRTKKKLLKRNLTQKIQVFHVKYTNANTLTLLYCEKKMNCHRELHQIFGSF